MWMYIAGDEVEYRVKELRSSAKRTVLPREERAPPKSRVPGDFPKRTLFGWRAPDQKLPDQPLGLTGTFW